MAKPNKSDDTCEYCGEQATCRDHVIPRSYLRATGKPNWRRDWTVPACHECNVLLGSQLLVTIETRAEYLLERYLRLDRRKTITQIRLQHLAGVVNRPEPKLPERAKPKSTSRRPTNIALEPIAYDVVEITALPIHRKTQPKAEPIPENFGQQCLGRQSFERRILTELDGFLDRKKPPAGQTGG